VRGLNSEDFAVTTESQKETGANCLYTDVPCLVPVAFREFPLRKLANCLVGVSYTTEVPL